MSNFNPSYNSTVDNVATTFADRTALSLPDLKRDIITAFHAKTVFAPRGLMRGTNSYSARFPASWKTTAGYHTVGTRLLGQTDPPARNYRDITLDDRLVAHLFVDELDAKARGLINFQGMFGEEMGHAIAQTNDQNVAIIACLAARAAATVTGGGGGLVIQKSSADTNVGALNAAIWDIKNGMDEQDVPEPGRTLVLRPAQYNLMASSMQNLFYREIGQGGSVGGKVLIPSYAGFEEILYSNNLPSTNIASSATGTRNTYAGDFTKTVASAFQRGAFGTVYSESSLPQGGNSQPADVNAATQDARMMPLDVRDVEIEEAYGTLYLTSLITGHGILNPVRAAEIRIP